MRNTVSIPTACPVCGAQHELGFEIDVGGQVGDVLLAGETLTWPSDGTSAPQGKWESRGVGRCKSCLAWIEVAVVMEGLNVMRVDNVREMGFRQTKGRATVNTHLPPKPPRHSSTLP